MKKTDNIFKPEHILAAIRASNEDQRETMRRVKQKEESHNLCVQCHREMQGVLGGIAWAAVCIYPDCPNYGLLQAIDLTNKSL